MSKKTIAVSIDVTNVTEIKSFMNIITDMLWDERIPEEIRSEYQVKISETFGEKNE